MQQENLKEYFHNQLQKEFEDIVYLNQDTIQFELKHNKQKFYVSLILCEFSYQQKNSNFVNNLQSCLTPKKKEPMILILVEEKLNPSKLKNVEDFSVVKSQMLINIIQKMRNPLNCSMNLLELLQTKISKESCEDYLLPAIYSNKMIQNSINDIYDFSIIEQGKFVIRKDLFNLESALYDCLELIQIQAQIKNIKLVFKYDDCLPNTIVSDCQRLKQIVVTLLTNALKYTQEGEITLNIQNQDAEHFTVAISDTGRGIDNDVLDKLFQLFPSMTTLGANIQDVSTGFSLFIANMLAMCLGDFQGIKVKSQLNAGTEFSFRVRNCDSGDKSQTEEISHHLQKLCHQNIVRLIQQMMVYECEDQSNQRISSQISALSKGSQVKKKSSQFNTSCIINDSENTYLSLKINTFAEIKMKDQMYQRNLKDN